MKTRNLFMNILGVFIALLFAGTVARAATITVLETFDFPGAGNNTLPQKINDDGEIVGSVIDSAGVTKGFLRSRSGIFSNAFAEPNDTGNLTQGRGVNNRASSSGSTSTEPMAPSTVTAVRMRSLTNTMSPTRWTPSRSG